jgi:V/A-type H+/Na+-transporting ATPase subunit C
MVRLSENPEYGFAIGRVRALEAALLDRARYERLIRAQAGEEFVAILAETAYSKFLEGGSADVPQAFDRAAGENVAFFSQYALDPWLLDMVRLPAAFRSLKAALKTGLSRGDSEAATPAEFLAPRFAPPANAAVAAAAAGYEKNRDPAVIDMAMDRLMQKLLLDNASASEFVVGYLGLHADVENLRTLVRVKAQPGEGEGGERRTDMEAAFLLGGALAMEDFAAALPEPWAAVVDRFAKAPPYGVGNEVFRDYLEQGTAAVADKHSFVRMERYGREIELGFLRQTRYATAGYEPLVAFFLLHENELRNLRQLYAAKLAGVAMEIAQDLVAYVD